MCGRGDAWRGHAWLGGGLHGKRDGHCSGRYASYWNAFLFFNDLTLVLISDLPPPTPLSTVLVTIPWAGKPRLIEFHSIDKNYLILLTQTQKAHHDTM